jgi:ribose transport system permease protein
MVPTALNMSAITSIIMLTLLLSFASAGQTLVLIGGGMDFTVGAVMSAAAILTTAIMDSKDGRFLPAFGAVMGVCLIVGLLNGVCTVKIGLPPMIVTLAISNIISRMQYVLTQGSPLGYASPAFIKTVTSKLFNTPPLSILPSLSLYAVILIPLTFYILNRSRFGRQVYLVGNNPAASRLSGIRVNRVVILTYVISALFSGFTGMLGAAYMQSAKCNMFDGYAYNSLIAVIVGGTALTGGVGSYTGSIAGSLLMVVLNNTLTALNLAQPARNILLGLVLVLLLILYNRGKSVRQ